MRRIIIGIGVAALLAAGAWLALRPSVPAPVEETPTAAPAVSKGAEPTASASEADAVTQATDVTTGASQVVEANIGGDIAVRYTTLENGIISVTAEEIARVYALDELAANPVFKDKRLRVWGTVARTSPSGAAKPWIVLAPDDKAATGGKDIRCAMAGPVAATVKIGDKITVEGVGAGMTFTVNLVDGVVTR